MNSRYLRFWDGKHAERIVLPQISFGREGKLRQIFKDLEVAGTHAGVVEFRAIVRNIVVGMLKRPRQPLVLQLSDVLQRSHFNWIELSPVGLELLKFSHWYLQQRFLPPGYVLI